MISVVCSTYQRGHLLDRSLACYHAQNLNVPFELIVIDDGSTDNTQHVVDYWAQYLDITYIKKYKQPGVWRDCATTINTGIRAAKGSLIIPTHPEVMPGKQSLQALWDLRREYTYLACKIYYLTPAEQLAIDTVAWPSDGAVAVRDLPGFYDPISAEFTGNKDYGHAEMEKHESWDSWVFGGFTRETWKWFGGFTEFTQWGSVDVDFLNRRNALKILTLSPQDLNTFCVHQNHDLVVHTTDVATPRHMDAALRDLPQYPTPESARKQYI